MSVLPVYLSGQIQGLAREDAAAWRNRVKALLHPHQPVINPLDRGFDGVDFTTIVESDIADIGACRAVLVKFDRPSVGTSMEIRYAYAERHIPVYVVDTSGAPRSPWLTYHTTRFFNTLEEACAFLQLEVGQ